jgi:2-dehydro-3-deoxyphosphogluconate aldolase / (4S)-4-hydroxy-2-oxoglutarate aldolase
MAKELFSWEKFEELPVVGIMRNFSLQEVMGVLPVYKSAGLSSIEITMNTADAASMIRQAIDQYKGSLNIGAGTVCSLAELRVALDAGAQFIVTPTLQEEVIRACVQNKVPVFAGAFTPTEIFNAWAFGASMVKVFPATSLGHEYIKEIKGPLPHIKLMPTGGVSPENCTDFLKAGADGLGMGSQLLDKKHIHVKNWSALEAHFKALVKKIRDYNTIKASMKQ